MKALQLSASERAEIEKRRRETHDKRIYMRLSCLLWVADGRERKTVASLLGITNRTLRNWLRTYRNQGIIKLCTLAYQGDPGELTVKQVDILKSEVAEGRFRSSAQIRHWILLTFGIAYSPSGVKDLLARIGVTFHLVTGFLWKGNRKKQRAFVERVKRHRREMNSPGAVETVRLYVDACHPVWGVNLVYRCWLLLGQRLLVGMGSGRKRMNILGAYNPDTHQYTDYRITRDNINGEQFVNFLRVLKEFYPHAKRIILYVDGATYYSKPCVKEWLAEHPEFLLSVLPPYSPNCNLIERLWKFMRGKALETFHKTFEDMEEAVSKVLDHLDQYRDELITFMTEEFHIPNDDEVPVKYKEAA